MAYDLQTVRAKENLKLSHGGPCQVQVSGTNPPMKVLGQGLHWNRFKLSSKIFYWPFQGRTSFVDLLCSSVLCLLCLCARLFICALCSPAGKGLTSWLSFVVYNCEFVTFLSVSLVRCGTWLDRFLIFAPLLTLMHDPPSCNERGQHGYKPRLGLQPGKVPL